ncbi:MAG TPA: transcription antitermination factor NusB [Magnetospirillaceae bacterium]|jgi:N utilization substance protein B
MSDGETKLDDGKRGPRRLSAARLAAVQALYQSEMTGASADAIIRDFVDHGVGRTTMIGPEAEDLPEVEVPLAKPDATLFASLVRGALERIGDLDQMIAGALNEGWSVGRLEVIMLSILRAGAYELSTRSDIPPRVSISEYTDVAGAFYGGSEPGLVNAVLDRIARVVRGGEIGNRAGA